MAVSYLTPDGYEKLKNELEHLKTWSILKGHDLLFNVLGIKCDSL